MYILCAYIFCFWIGSVVDPLAPSPLHLHIYLLWNRTIWHILYLATTEL